MVLEQCWHAGHPANEANVVRDVCTQSKAWSKVRSRRDDGDVQDGEAAQGHHLLSSHLPDTELSDERLIDEGVLIAAAASETTAWAITITTHHIMRKPAVLAQLHTRLQPITPSVRAREAVADWTVLEKLPYLTAAIKGGAPMAGGMLSRLPRIYNKEGTRHLRQALLIDEAVLREPRRFDPDRWLDRVDRVDQDPTTSRLDKYLVAFSKGSRNCIGMHLAYAQLYMCVAAVCGKFELEMYQTDDTDATPTRDLFTAGTQLDKNDSSDDEDGGGTTGDSTGPVTSFIVKSHAVSQTVPPPSGTKPKKNVKDYATQRDVVAWRRRDEGLSDIENDKNNSGQRRASRPNIQPGSALYDYQNVNQNSGAVADDSSGNPYKFDTPDAVGDFVRERRWKRRKLIEEECMWNDGLRNWIRQRDVWTGAVETKELPQAGDHVLRSCIQPLAYPVIYSKVVVQTLTPNIPIPLTHMTKILVEGWKSEGNWPPADTRPAMTAAATTKRPGRSAREESVFGRKSKDGGDDMDVGIEFREHSGNDEDGEQETAEDEREASRVY
ncbi:hypothetical protein DV737_g4896, partial [Chaetothyriales sp. CBS 132003]